MFLYSSLTPEQRNEKNGLVMFKIDDQDFMGMTNEFIAETFVHFKDIPSTQLENEADNSPQIRLTLTVPKSLGNHLIYFLTWYNDIIYYVVIYNIIIVFVSDSKFLSAIENRSGTDKVAKNFIKKIKIKIAASNQTPKK